MKLTFLFFLLCITSVLANPANSQTTKVNIMAENTRMKDVISQIEAQTDYLFVYNYENVDLSHKVSLKVSDMSVAEVLKIIFKNSDVRYAVEGNNILLLKNEVSGQQQNGKKITGVVVDAKGEAIIGANIVEKGTTNGTTTDVDGKFSLLLPEKAIIQLSYIGYLSKEMSVNNQSNITVTLLEDSQNLEEVVVVGYGTQRKATLTGSVAAVKGAEIVKSPSVNVTQSLAGRLPGVIINSRSGEPGKDDPSIMIRGRGTTGETDVLVIIDGVERGGLGQLNPNDIENITVLKDASAAIYGSRAANGVILVTTKRGAEGKPSINFSFNQGYSQPTRNPRMADAYTFAKMTNNIELTEGRDAVYSDTELQKYRDGSDPNYPNTDWYGYIVKKLTPQHRSNVSVSGGNDRAKYYFSLGELMQKGQYKNGSTEFRSYNLRSNVDVQVTDNLKVGLNVSGRIDNRHYPFRTNNELNSHIYLYQPNWQPYWPGTDYMQPLRGSENIHNWVTDNAGYQQEDTRTAQGSLTFKWDLPWIKGLSVDGTGSYDFGGVYTKKFEKPTYVYQMDKQTGEYAKTLSGMSPALANLNNKSYAVTQLYFTGKINYARQFDLHNMGVMVGYEQIQIKNSTLEAGRSDFLSTSLPEIDMGSSDKSKQSNRGFSGQDARQNFFGRVNYDYAGKYLAEFTMRVDGSSKFPKNKRYGYFPGASLGWRMSEESFMKNLDFISNLKIRGSFGKMGNDIVDPFQYMMTYGFKNNYVIGNNDVSGLVQTNVPNPYITWETAKTWNAGFDASLWSGLLDIEFDYFNSRRSDILTKRSASIPEYTGLELPDENIGIVDNKGFELVLSHTNKINKLSYRLSANVSFARNKVVFADEQPAAESYQYFTGRPHGAGLYYKALGVFKDQAQVDATPHLPGTQPGDLIY